MTIKGSSHGPATIEWEPVLGLEATECGPLEWIKAGGPPILTDETVRPWVDTQKDDAR